MPTIHLTSDPSSKALPWTLTLDENDTAARHACIDRDVTACLSLTLLGSSNDAMRRW